MDVYLPPGLGPGERRPAILFVHGGPVGEGMKPKGMGVFKSYGALAAASGFVGVTFDHRYYGPASLTEADQDVAALEAHVRAQAADLHVDEERLALWAFSGGGPFLSRTLRERPAHVRVVVAYYPVLDLREAASGATPEPSLEERTRLSPAAQLGPGERPLPPILVARAGHDDARLNSTVLAFVREGLQGGAPLELLNHPAGRHGFDILDDDARSREIVARTFDFLKTHLREPGSFTQPPGPPRE